MNRINFLKCIGLVMLLAACNDNGKTQIEVSDQAILIHNGSIINVIDGSILEHHAILIDSGKIKAIGDFEPLKSLVDTKRQFDVGGKFIIPGLWDMHVHLEGADLVEDNLALMPVYIAYGVTTVRDMASDLGEQVLSWRDEINGNQLLGPQIFTAGRKLEGINSIWKDDLEIANEEELAQMLDLLEDYDVDLVKITENTLSGSLFLKSVKEASRRGFKVSGHIPLDLTIQEVILAGFSSIEHASYLLRLGSDEIATVAKVISGEFDKTEANEYYNSHFNQDTAILAYKRLSKTGIAITPTLIGGNQLAYLDQTHHGNDEFLQYLSKRFTSNYQWRIDRMANDTPEQKQARKDRQALIAKQLPYLQAAGITILAGSDAAALNTYVYPALSLHQELELFQKAGLTPLQTLQSATINGAKWMGKLSTMATIDVEKQADLVIINTNPLLDIKATQDIHAVVNNGIFYSRSDLDIVLLNARAIKQKLDSIRESE